MKMTAVVILSCVSIALVSCEGKKDSGSDEQGNRQVVSAQAEVKGTFLFFFNRKETGNIIVKCKGRTSPDILTKAAYESAKANGTICPSREVTYSVSSNFCTMNFSSGGITINSVPESAREKLKADAKAACLKDEATQCEIHNIQVGTCFETPVVDTSTTAGIIAASSQCVSTEYLKKQQCSLSVTVKGISANTN